VQLSPAGVTAAGAVAAGRIPAAEHLRHPWRIHELVDDFRLEDVWALPTPGGPDELPRLVEHFTSADLSRSRSAATRALWSLRTILGAVLGWDRAQTGLGSRVASLRGRLPEDLRAKPGPDVASLPFDSLYMTADEWAAEIANQTMHGVVHLGWVADGDGRYHGQMSVYVKPNGLLGEAYMAAIRPFRHLVVYPALIAQIEREWGRGPERPRGAPRRAAG
jgi:hypothetical protein